MPRNPINSTATAYNVLLIKLPLCTLSFSYQTPLDHALRHSQPIAASSKKRGGGGVVPHGLSSVVTRTTNRPLHGSCVLLACWRRTRVATQHGRIR
ncbi:hypothetical protein GW17_00013918 [Ensete ventricosum]|nr:hypothetical protein GW17_00013918 [Ensete ventricosum]